MADTKTMSDKIVKSEAEWRSELTPVPKRRRLVRSAATAMNTSGEAMIS